MHREVLGEQSRLHTCYVENPTADGHWPIRFEHPDKPDVQPFLLADGADGCHCRHLSVTDEIESLVRRGVVGEAQGREMVVAAEQVRVEGEETALQYQRTPQADHRLAFGNQLRKKDRLEAFLHLAEHCRTELVLEPGEEVVQTDRKDLPAAMLVAEHRFRTGYSDTEILPMQFRS